MFSSGFGQFHSTSSDFRRLGVGFLTRARELQSQQHCDDVCLWVGVEMGGGAMAGNGGRDNERWEEGDGAGPGARAE